MYRSSLVQSIKKNISRRYFCSDNKLSQFLGHFTRNLKAEMMGQTPESLPPPDHLNEHADKNQPVRFLHAFRENFQLKMQKERATKVPQNPFGAAGNGGGFGPSVGPGGGGLPGGGNFLQWFLENCHRSHAQEIAHQMGVNLRSIDFQTQGSNAKAFLDVPGASEEQVKLLSERIKNECPMTQVNRAAGNEDVEFVRVRK